MRSDDKGDYAVLAAIMVGVMLLFLGSLVAGCKTMAPLKGGAAAISDAIARPFTKATETPAEATRPSSGSRKASAALPADGMRLEQGDNPATPASQSFENSREDTLIFAAPTTITEVVKSPSGGEITRKIEVPAGSQRVSRDLAKGGQTLGAAQKDTSRELAAKLASYSKLQWVGVGLMVFGVAGLFYAPLRIILGGGKQFPVGIGALGALLTVAPMLIAGNEGVILGGAVLLAGIGWGVVRLTRKETEADVVKGRAQ